MQQHGSQPSNLPVERARNCLRPVRPALPLRPRRRQFFQAYPPGSKRSAVERNSLVLAPAHPQPRQARGGARVLSAHGGPAGLAGSRGRARSTAVSSNAPCCSASQSLNGVERNAAAGCAAVQGRLPAGFPGPARTAYRSRTAPQLADEPGPLPHRTGKRLLLHRQRVSGAGGQPGFRTRSRPSSVQVGFVPRNNEQVSWRDLAQEPPDTDSSRPAPSET